MLKNQISNKFKCTSSHQNAKFYKNDKSASGISVFNFYKLMSYLYGLDNLLINILNTSLVFQFTLWPMLIFGEIFLEVSFQSFLDTHLFQSHYIAFMLTKIHETILTFISTLLSHEWKHQDFGRLGCSGCIFFVYFVSYGSLFNGCFLNSDIIVLHIAA